MKEKYQKENPRFPGSTLPPLLSGGLAIHRPNGSGSIDRSRIETKLLPETLKNKALAYMVQKTRVKSLVYPALCLARMGLVMVERYGRTG